MVATKTTTTTPLGAPILLAGEDDAFFSSASAAAGATASSAASRYVPLTSRDIASEIILRLLLLAGIVIIDILVPHAFKRQVVGLNWANYAYPYTPVETISFPTLLIVGLTVPLAIVIVITFARHHHPQQHRVILNFVLAITLSICLSECLTSLFKKTFGQLRPDYLSRCFATPDVKSWLAKSNMTFFDIPPIPTCVPQVAHSRLMEEARLSFPSGHSSFAAAAFGVLAMWLHMFIPTQFVIMMPSVRLVAAVGAATFPFYVAVTRTADYRHHPSDVIAGLLLGFSVALLSFRVYHHQHNSPQRRSSDSVPLLDLVKTTTSIDNTPTTRGPLDV